MRGLRQIALLIALISLLVGATTQPAEAHQPYFEDKDWTPDNSFRVKDPTVSTALYATLDRRDDVDYVQFSGRAGQNILIGLTIPQIEGQESFTPTFALVGPGLPSAGIPAIIETPPGMGAAILRAAAGPPRSFFEPFSRTSYWERQEDYFTLPADGEYFVAVWSETGEIGRYTLVIGDREIPGGDFAFPFKLRTFWTPVEAPPEPEPAPAQRCGGR